MPKSLPTALAGVLVAASLVIAAAPPAAADLPECHDPHVTIKTKSGQAVYVPTNRGAGPFQWGGSQSRTKSGSTMKATTKGSADTVGGGGSIGIGVAEVSARYDRQWNRNTSASSSKTSAFTTNSPTMPNNVHWRWKLYKKGRLFNATKTVRRPDACQGASVQRSTFRVAVPLKRGTYHFKVERYANRGQLLNNRGNPMGF